jgi:heme exporter protein C
MILPRMVQSLHPGGMEGAKAGGNPALGGNSLDSHMRLTFWLAVLGWVILGIWITTLKIRLSLIKDKNIIGQEPTWDLDKNV